MIENYKTFAHIENVHLRATNTAKVMANIFQDNSEGEEITNKGASLLFQYFDKVSAVDKALTFETFKLEMEERGYSYGG